MSVTVEQIKKLAPEAEVYALDGSVTHLIVLDANEVTSKAAEQLSYYLGRGLNLSVAIVSIPGGSSGLDIYKLNES